MLNFGSVHKCKGTSNGMSEHFLLKENKRNTKQKPLGSTGNLPHFCFFWLEKILGLKHLLYPNGKFYNTPASWKGAWPQELNMKTALNNLGPVEVPSFQSEVNMGAWLFIEWYIYIYVYIYFFCGGWLDQNYLSWIGCWLIGYRFIGARFWEASEKEDH